MSTTEKSIHSQCGFLDNDRGQFLKSLGEAAKYGPLALFTLGIEGLFEPIRDRVVRIAQSYIGICEPNAFNMFNDGIEDGEWCAVFVSKVLKEAGIPYAGGSIQDWKLTTCSQITNWYTSRNLYQFKESKIDPRPGDVVRFTFGQGSCGVNNHVAIVVDTVNYGRDLITVGGNEGPSEGTCRDGFMIKPKDCVRKTLRRSFRTNPHFIGFGQCM